MTVPRLRVFAGPNGSGKSTMKSAIPSHLIGIYINPDEIEKAAKESGRLEFSDFQLEAEGDEVLAFLREHRLVRSSQLDEEVAKIGFSSNGLNFQTVAMNSYFASVLSDFIRNKLLEEQLSFTFETVMSSDDKIAFMLKARESGYRTYLYFVATEDPDININRVRNRVAAGGHPVPTEKIVQRYGRCLSLLPAAIAASNRAYIFDNSGADLVLLAEVTDGTYLEFKVDEVPGWFMDAYVEKVLNG
ncbi:zeta toxin family protein [Pseudomonas veronii]|uniref:zeta toxin family protein n=1 Tax=Pseudomonas veronii TaxID=76761 RepID=UPI0006252251|nr:zeta toxin family protein [Pseudomonas veronii]